MEFQIPNYCEYYIQFILNCLCFCHFSYRSDYKNACLVTSVDRSMGFYLDEKPMKYNQNRKQHVRRGNYNRNSI